MGFFSDIFEKVKETARKVIPKEIVDVLPTALGIPGSFLREALEDPTGGGQWWERGLRRTPGDVLNNAAIMAAVLGGGQALGALGMGGAGGAGVGAGAGAAGGGGLNLGNILGSLGGGGGILGGLGSLLGGGGGGGQQWQQRTDPQGSTYWFDNQGNVTYQDPTGGGAAGAGGLDLGKILGGLGGILGGGAGAGAGGAGAGGIAPYSAYQPTPQLLPELMEQYRGMPEYQQYQDIFQQGLGGLEQLGDIGPEYFEQFGLAPMAPVGQEYFEGFGPTSMEEALANEYFKYAAPEAQRAIAQRMSLQGMGESPVTAALMGRETGKLGVDIGQYLSGLGQRRAELGLQDIQNLRGIGEQRAGRGLVGQAAATTARLGFDPAQMALQFAQQDRPLGQEYRQAQQYNEALRNAQKQAERGMFFDIASRGATALGQPQLGGLIGQAAPVFGGTYMGGGGQGVNPLQNIFQQLGLKNLFGTAQQV